jgi:hypothetical protein
MRDRSPAGRFHRRRRRRADDGHEADIAAPPIPHPQNRNPASGFDRASATGPGTAMSFLKEGDFGAE